MQIILASSSRYRKMMLSRLGLDFLAISPDVDESRLENETPPDLALRLAQLKAQTIAQQYPQAVVIGSDQVACLNDNILGKPGNFENAKAQLMAQSGQKVIFHTALAIHSPTLQKSINIPTICHYRLLSEQEIEHYLTIEKPFDTAGSAKAEGLGITLMSAIESQDPTAIIGLPLITLSEMLRQCGINPTLCARSLYE